MKKFTKDSVQNKLVAVYKEEVQVSRDQWSCLLAMLQDSTELNVTEDSLMGIIQMIGKGQVTATDWVFHVKPSFPSIESGVFDEDKSLFNLYTQLSAAV